MEPPHKSPRKNKRRNQEEEHNNATRFRSLSSGITIELFILSVVMNDMFTDEDCVNIPGSIIWNHLRFESSKPTEEIYGDICLYNENSDEIIDFLMDDFVYILSKMKRHVADALCDCIR